jgi:hypothetical protein
MGTSAGCASGPAVDASASARTAAALRPVFAAPPARYSVPHGALRVSSSRALRAALRRHDRRVIALAPGAYGGHRPFLNPHGHDLYGVRPGRAILRAGVSLGGNTGRGGAVVRGSRSSAAMSTVKPSPSRRTTSELMRARLEMASKSPRQRTASGVAGSVCAAAPAA